MLNKRDAAEVLDHDFLEARCKILEIAATLDRIDRARRGTTNTRMPDLVSSGAPSRPSSNPVLDAPRRFSGSSRWITTPPGARK